LLLAFPMLSPSKFIHDIENVARIDAVPLILNMVKHATGMRFAAVARVTDAHWVACAVDDSIDFGLEPGGELVLDTTICNEIRQHRQPVIFQHATEHEVYSQHHTPKLYQLESYVSIPIIRSNGEFFGTLCAIDSNPAQFDEESVLKTLTLFAQLIAVQLDMQETQKATDQALIDETETGRLRERFIAVLGHDLRSPLTAIGMSAERLETRLPAGRERDLATAIRNSSARMGGLVGDVLDFSRGHLGGGIPVHRELTSELGVVLNSVIDEVMASYPQVPVIRRVIIAGEFYCDVNRVGQLLSNLLVNAITHGRPTFPVEVTAATEQNELVMSVANQGDPIAPQLLSTLFRPFTRSEASARREGLGLGLYIAEQIVAGHQGTLDVSSTPEAGTCFVARWPVIALNKGASRPSLGR